jgi:hypothetical protein
MVARISCPFSSFTLNIALLKASVIIPSCLMSACLAILFGRAKIGEFLVIEKNRLEKALQVWKSMPYGRKPCRNDR